MLVNGSTAEKREYQIRLIDKTIGLMDQGIKTIMINSPTGSGKTAMGLAIAKIIQDKYNVGVAWMAMRRNLLKQAAAENRKLNIGLSAKFISMFDSHPPTHDDDGRPIKFLCCDESHHAPVSSSLRIQESLQPDYVLGLTATPFRTDHLRLSFSKVLIDIGIPQLIEQGYLSPYHAYTIDNWNVDTVVDTYLREPERWGKSVFFFHRRDQAQEATDRINAAGITADLVTAETDRDTQIEQFEAGETRCLVNMLILGEGFDSPSLQTVFCRDSQKLPTTQMAGRVFRKYPGIPFKQIVQSKQTKWPMQRTAMPACSYVWQEEEWRSYALSVKVEQASAEAINVLAHTVATMPQYIKDKMEKGRRRRRRAQPRNMQE